MPRTQAVGGLQADGADAAVADLLGDLGRDRDLLALELGDHLDRDVDLGQARRGELDVDDRSGDRDDATVLQVFRTGGIGGQGHGKLSVLLRWLAVGRARGEEFGVAAFDGVGEEILVAQPARAGLRRHPRSP